MKMTAFKLQDMAKEVVDSATEGGDLNAAIAKVAAREELNPTQIQRLVEVANHGAYDRTYKTAKDKRFAFKLASRDEVMTLLGKKPETEKTAADDSFFELRRNTQFEKAASETPPLTNHYRAMGGAEAVKKGLLNELNHALYKLNSYQSELRTEMSGIDYSVAESMRKLAAETRRLMLEERVSYADLYKAASNGMDEKLRPLVDVIFKKLAGQLSTTTKLANALEDDLLKKFDPKDYKELGGDIINGNQPLMIHLKACVRDLGDRCCIAGPYDSTSGMASGVVTAIHELNSAKDVSDYVANEVQSFANNVRKGVKYAMAYILANENSDGWFAKKAGIGALAKGLVPSLQLAQILNQLTGGAETGGSIVKKLMSDLMSPVDVRTGTVISEAAK